MTHHVVMFSGGLGSWLTASRVVDADVSVLKDRTGGTATPLTLRRFRERIEDQPDLFDPLDFGGCGCFTEGETE